MDKFGCKTHLTQLTNKKTGRQYNYLTLPHSEVLVGLLRTDLQTMRENNIPVCGKVSLLNEMIDYYPKHVAYGCMSNKSRSFLEFLTREMRRDKTARVVVHKYRLKKIILGF
jgi:hypothetical protein